MEGGVNASLLRCLSDFEGDFAVLGRRGAKRLPPYSVGGPLPAGVSCANTSPATISLAWTAHSDVMTTEEIEGNMNFT
jgi:hypothetical protein